MLKNSVLNIIKKKPAPIDAGIGGDGPLQQTNQAKKKEDEEAQGFLV